MFNVNILDHEAIKDSNKKKILNLLYKERELTKQDIAKITRISIPTVTNNINELIEEGIIKEAGVADSSGGRKPVVLRFLPDSRYSFGVDFSSLNNVRIILANLDSVIKYDIKLNIAGVTNMEQAINHVHSSISQLIQTENIPVEKILGVGISLPGTVNEETMILEKAPNLGMKNIPFKRYAEKFKFPIFIENEANAAAYAELTLGIAKEMRNLVYISITQGIGAGIVINGQLYKGKNKRAGEFGHMTVVSEGRPCRCGKSGCWELYASIRALLDEYNQKSGYTTISLEDFYLRLSDGDKIANFIWRDYIGHLSKGIENIILFMDPHYLVIGGDISQYGSEILNHLKERIFTENSFFNTDDIKILLSKLGENASILGASLLPMQKLFYPYVKRLNRH